MRTIETKELREIQLSILADVADFCESNGVRYFLAYGTLLGAVRHKGYIPWDDDIDLFMPRPDYEIFLKMYNRSGRQYKAIHTENDNAYFVNFAKVHDDRTRFQESYSIETSYGVFIDIFPLDAYVSECHRRYCAFLFRLLHYKSLTFNKGFSIMKNCMLGVVKTLLSPIPIRKVCRILEKASQKGRYENAEFVFDYSENKPPIDKMWFEHFVYLPFEGHQYRVPKDYKKLLELTYGEYMKLPPENERVNKHNAKVWWK